MESIQCIVPRMGLYKLILIISANYLYNLKCCENVRAPNDQLCWMGYPR